MNFHITKAEDRSVPAFPGVAVFCRTINWHPSPVGFDDDGEPIYEPMTPEDAEKMEWWRAYRVAMMKYNLPDGELVQKTIMSPWFDSRDEQSATSAKRQALGMAIECAML